MSTETKREWTWQEIKDHNTTDSCWIYLERDVYDVTKWLPKHPGGKDTILLFSGRDCTECFRAYHAFTERPYAEIKQYKIGQLKGPSEAVRWNPDSGFYKALRERLRVYFKKNNIDPVQQSFGYEVFRFMTSIVLFMVGYQCIYKLADWGVSLLMRIALHMMVAIPGTMIAINVGHMSSHVATFHKPTLNYYLGWFSFDVCMGISWGVWLHEHVVGHHQYTNLIGIDPNAPDTHEDSALYRSSPNQKWHKRFYYQWIWFPLISFLLVFENRVAMFRYWLKGLRFDVRVNAHYRDCWSLFLFIVGKCLFVGHLFCLPVFYWQRPVWEVCAIIFFTDMSAGYFIGITFPANHITDKVEWPLFVKDKDGGMKMDAEWAVTQVKTCKDYAPTSWIFSHCFGGLNNHSCHHLFPALHHSYYAEIYPIVKQVVKEYNIVPPDVASYWDLVYDYIHNLYMLGYEPKKKAH